MRTGFVEPESPYGRSNEMEQEEYSLPPGTLFISFMLVSGGYVLSVTLLFIFAFSLATVYSPETIEAAGNDPAIFEQQLQNNASDLLPQKLYWPLLLLDALGCVAIGFCVARLARFAKFSHCIFLAVIIFIGFLQSAMAAPAEIQWMLIGFMAIAPIATLVGGRLCLALPWTTNPDNAGH